MSGAEPILKARLAVVDHYNFYLPEADKIVGELLNRRGQGYEIEHAPSTIEIDDTYVVLFSYILGGWKAHVSTVVPDDRYYEVTFDTRKGSIYVDCWKKESNHELEADHPIHAV